MSTKAIRRLLEDTDIPDPHEFATAFVSLVESGVKMNLVDAVRRWVANGSLV